MNVIICPGIHPPELTDRFVASLSNSRVPSLRKPQQGHSSIEHNLLVFPANQYPAYSAWHIYHWLQQQKLVSQELLFITFSAGVVGGMGAAIALQLRGFKIVAFIAIDGWGVPLLPMFPLYRLSHDYFTHWSSAILGAGNESFYAEPSKSHLEIWRSPETCQGWRVISGPDGMVWEDRGDKGDGRDKGDWEIGGLGERMLIKKDRKTGRFLFRCSARDYLKFLIHKINDQ